MYIKNYENYNMLNEKFKNNKRIINSNFEIKNKGINFSDKFECSFTRNNNSEKGEKTDEIIHPYTDSLLKKFKFQTDFEEKFDLTYLLGMSENSKRIFKLVELYKLNKDIVQEIIRKAIIYNESKVDEIYNNFNYMFNNREEVVQTIVGSYIEEKDFGKKSLSKLKYDMSK